MSQPVRPRLPAFLGVNTPFPPLEQALGSPAGLLAVGADLGIDRLRAAYSRGIFPWYVEGEPILWWSPDPRMVLYIDRFAPSHTLRKKLRQVARDGRIEVRVDTAFAQVMRECAAPRDAAAGPSTWISPAMQQAYTAWHRAGEVHSIETWMDGELVGGLYGVSLGRAFFGESMFTRVSDASKIALAYLVAWLGSQGVRLIDCQQNTQHLSSMGGGTIPRADFARELVESVAQPALPWQPGMIRPDGTLVPLHTPSRAPARGGPTHTGTPFGHSQ